MNRAYFVRLHWILAATAALWTAAAPAPCKVERVEILERTPFADGMAFGETGAYEVIKGRLRYSADPNNPANAKIVDLKLAPVNAEGKVEFEGDFLLLKPVDLSKGNRRLLYGVNNRGNILALAYFNNAAVNNDPKTAEDAGNGFLMREGYSILWSGWNWDVPEGNNRLRIDLPIATNNGETITQLINAELNVVSESATTLAITPRSIGYEVADPSNNAGATLTVRTDPDGPRTRIPNERWRFAAERDGEIVQDPHHVYFGEGFRPGMIYELLYVARDPRVVGLGLAAVRDAISFFRYEREDRRGNPNPLTMDGGDGLVPAAENAYIFGVSQSGRLIVHSLFQGFHVDEAGRMVYGAAWPHVAGGGKGSFNHRFAQTTRHPSHLEGNTFPADFFPFTYCCQFDNASHRYCGVLTRAVHMDKVPFVFVTNNALEYWTRSASLIHTDPAGMTDAPLLRKVRMYMVNGAPHFLTGSRTSDECAHSRSTLDGGPVGRALLTALDAWVSEGKLPPPNAVPRIARGELLSAEEHKAAFPAIPGMRHPGRTLRPPRLDYGPRFWTEGIQDIVPPRRDGPPYQTLVPNFDSDGNGVGGIRLPELEVPLGTYQGFNPRAERIGNPDYLTRFDGSFWMFPPTREERLATGDPRPSIEERYPSHGAYIERARMAADALVERRFLLPEDRDSYAKRAEGMAWPPEPINGPPYWAARGE